MSVCVSDELSESLGIMNNKIVDYNFKTPRMFFISVFRFYRCIISLVLCMRACIYYVFNIGYGVISINREIFYL